MTSVPDSLIATWSKEPGADGLIRVVATHPLTDKLPNSLEVHVKAATGEQRFRVVNDGYWGIPIKPSTTYQASFYVKGAPSRARRYPRTQEGTPFTHALTRSQVAES